MSRFPANQPMPTQLGAIVTFLTQIPPIGSVLPLIRLITTVPSITYRRIDFYTVEVVGSNLLCPPYFQQIAAEGPGFLCSIMLPPNRSLLSSVFNPLAAVSATSSLGYCSRVPMIAVRRTRFPSSSTSLQRNSQQSGPVFALYAGDSRAESFVS